ncbi:unnamed protein product [Parnassius apollo]|uniref:(apollo) hypothetical protein n=1 Tax=Parnassius apollo TaxID=110799 RepID=A0A8S3WED8_PARAO|nr:unnamed protein product [Parnassius apollo]
MVLEGISKDVQADDLTKIIRQQNEEISEIINDDGLCPRSGGHPRRVRVTNTLSKGCIQESTCGPVLWNIILDELLDAKLPAGCHTQAFADDVLLVVTAASVGELELAFGPIKTKLIAFTPKAKVASINMDEHRLSFVPEVKLLGVILHEKLNFGKHVKHVINKAVRIFNKLCMYSRYTWGAHPENISTIY